MEEKLKAISIRVNSEIMDRIDNIVIPLRIPRTAWVQKAILAQLKKDENEKNDLD
jgi:predicted transcriptional regulator